ncbi:MAG: hypothetical protein V2A79_00850, partial [Planctomycetota bacterium]
SRPSERSPEGGCLMDRAAIEECSARAEDKATVGTDLSAAPGAKTEGRAADRNVRRPSFPTPFGIGIKALNPSRRSREFLKTQTPGDGLPDVANSERPIVHFTLNHYNTTEEGWQ